MIGAPPGGSRGATANQVKAGSGAFAKVAACLMCCSQEDERRHCQCRPMETTITVEANEGWSPAPANAISLQIHQERIPEGRHAGGE